MITGCSNWSSLLAEFAAAKRTLVIMSPVGGGIRGTILAVRGDYVHMKVPVHHDKQELPTKVTNVYLPMQGIFGIEVEDECEVDGVPKYGHRSEIPEVLEMPIVNTPTVCELKLKPIVGKEF